MQNNFDQMSSPQGNRSDVLRNIKTTRSNSVLRTMMSESRLIKKLAAELTRKGKKAIAEKIIRHCCIWIELKEKRKGASFIARAIHNVKPFITIGHDQENGHRRRKPRPVPLATKTGEKLAIKWIIQGAKQRKERFIGYGLYLELLNAYQKKGYAINKREELHKKFSQKSAS